MVLKNPCFQVNSECDRCKTGYFGVMLNVVNCCYCDHESRSMSTDVCRSHVDACADYKHKRVFLIIWHIRSMLRLSAQPHVTSLSKVSSIFRWHQVARKSSGKKMRSITHKRNINPLLSNSLDKGSTYFNASKPKPALKFSANNWSIKNWNMKWNFSQFCWEGWSEQVSHKCYQGDNLQRNGIMYLLLTPVDTGLV